MQAAGAAETKCLAIGLCLKTGPPEGQAAESAGSRQALFCFLPGRIKRSGCCFHFSWLENHRDRFQTKMPAPEVIRKIPMKMTAKAASRSPRRRNFRERIEVKRPAASSVGMVPRPKATMVRKPATISCSEAALTIMAQERQQGMKPTSRPRRAFAPDCCD